MYNSVKSSKAASTQPGNNSELVLFRLKKRKRIAHDFYDFFIESHIGFILQSVNIIYCRRVYKVRLRISRINSCLV